MVNCRLLVLVVPFLIFSTGTAAQTSSGGSQIPDSCASPGQRARPYLPEYELPKDHQIVVLYIGAADCVACRTPETKAAVREMKPLLACQAKASHRSLAIVGVSLDWQVDTAVAFLNETGPYDEIIGGGNWVNVGALDFIWRDGRPPSIPQLILLERTFDSTRTAIRVREERELARFLTPGALQAWVKKGAPIPAAPRSPP